MLSVNGGQQAGTPVVTTSTGNILLSNANIQERSASGVYIGTLSVDLPGAWTFALVSGYSANGCVALSSTANNQIVTTVAPLVYASNPAPTVRVIATRWTPYQVITQDVTLNVLASTSSSAATPTVDLDLIRQTYVGAALSDIGLAYGDLDVDGYHAPGAIDEYLTPNAMNPGGAGWSSTSGATIASTQATTSDGFTPVVLNVGSNNHWGVSTTRALVVGEIVTVSIRVGVGNQVGTPYFYFGGAFSTSFLSPDANVAAAGWRMPGYNRTDGMCVSQTQNSDGSWTCVYHVTATAAAALAIAIGANQNSTTLVLYGVQIHAGRSTKPWVPTGANGQATPYKPLTLANVPASIMAGSAWSIALECHQVNSNYPAPMLADGSGTMAQVTGFTQAAAGRTASQVLAKVGTGGFLGITRVVIANDATGCNISINDGVIETGPALTVSGAVQLLTNCQTVLRRVSLWNSKLSNADLRTVSAISNKQMLQIGTALVPQNATEVFFDDFLSSASIAQRPGSGQTFNAGTFDANFGLYKGQPGNWIPRYANWTWPIGSHQQSINSEVELYVDPQFCGDGSLTGGYLGPIDFNTPSCATITIQTLASLPTAMQNLIPLEQLSTTSTVQTYKWQYVSGALTAPYAAQVGVNSFWSVRMQVPNHPNCWPAFWAMGIVPADAPYSFDQQTELDILEIFGPTTGQLACSFHANSYAINKTYYLPNLAGSVLPYAGTYLPNDFHTYEAFWTNGRIDYGMSGQLMATNYTSGNMDTYQLYPLLNVAYYTDISAGADALLPAHMSVDHVRILSMGALPPTLEPLTLSTQTGVAATYTATLSGQTTGSTVTLIDASDGRFSLSGSTLTAVSGTAGTYTISIVEQLATSLNKALVSDFTIVLQ